MDTMKLQPGDQVRLAIYGSGSGAPDQRPLGYVNGIILGHFQWMEFSVMIDPGEDLDEVNDLLVRADVELADIQEGPVYVLHNMNPEWLSSRKEGRR